MKQKSKDKMIADDTKESSTVFRTELERADLCWESAEYTPYSTPHLRREVIPNQAT
jgi:hypothetical protein